jgi:hypothetical protein
MSSPQAFFSGRVKDTTDSSKKKKVIKAQPSNKSVLQKTNPMKKAKKDPLLEDVETDLHRRIHALGKSGGMFEEGADYIHDAQLAADAQLLVQGIDPQAARSADRFAASRFIQVQRKHWTAFKQGYVMTPYGMAYVHTDASIAMLPSGNCPPVECKCGAVHIA